MTYSIETKNISKSYNGKIILNNISLRLPSTGIFGVLGKNGAGKTTFLAMLMGLISPSSGEINILGLSLKKHKYKILNKINFQSPYVELPKKMSVYQNLLFYSRLYNVCDYKVVIKNLSKELFIEELLDLNYGKLSSGQKTRVNLCKALLNNPDLLLLDEPTASLDIQTSEFIREYLINYQKKKNSAILITSHNLEEISFMCNYLMIFDNGEIKVKGNLENILRKNKLKELIFDDS